VFQDDITDRDESMAARAAIDGMQLQVDEGAWWQDNESDRGYSIFEAETLIRARPQRR
jgi:hypothetical protein